MRKTTLSDIDEANRLFSTKHALAILDALLHDGRAEDAAPDDPQAVADAVGILTEMGLVQTAAPSPEGGAACIALTSKGTILTRVLDDISYDRDISWALRDLGYS